MRAAAASDEKELMANKGTCKADNCEREVIAKQYCRKHYRMWTQGEMPKPRYKTCTTEKCHKPRLRGSLCQEHWTAAHGAKAGTEAAPAAAEQSA